ncbi:cytochrome c oxidase assembly protein [Rhodococcus sp. NPDC060084]|uniref:cytochrome c oxidase assembly protein n=1 Tax=Rhodococcus sp. NPDC060084 TaxID=3347053 RepID=UPI00366218DB
MMPFVVWGVAICAVPAYWAAAAAAKSWSLARTAGWTVGWLALAAVWGNSASADSPAQGHGALHGHGAANESFDFAGHMVSHVVAGMAVPLLLVLAAPVTLALRVLPLREARRVSRVLRSRPCEVLTHPLVAATLNVGGLWLLYRTWLFDYMHGGTWVMWLIEFHIVAAGYLYTYSLVGVDPSPHRTSFGLRAAVLVVSIAAHNILAKTLYADPPPGVSAEQAEMGSQIMYYGGLPFELALVVLLCHRWAARARRRPEMSAPDLLRTT